MNGINFNDLPSDIKKLIFTKNRSYNNKINQEIILNKFWEEWSEDYEDELQELFDDDIISSWDWEDLNHNEKLNIYRSHKRAMDRHYSIMQDGSGLDDDYDIGLY